MQGIPSSVALILVPSWPTALTLQYACMGTNVLIFSGGSVDMTLTLSTAAAEMPLWTVEQTFGFGRLVFIEATSPQLHECQYWQSIYVP